MKKKAKLIYSVVAAILLISIGLDVSSEYMLDYSLQNNPQHASTYRGGMQHFKDTYPSLRTWIDSLQQCGALRDTFIVIPKAQNAEHSERQHAIYAKAENANGRTALLIHGYGDNSMGMLHIAYIYNKVMGYNIILPDLHGHGLSDGTDIQMGWFDRLDILQWIKVAHQMFKPEATPQAGKATTKTEEATPADVQMVIHGISMGAATTMCVAGEPTPDYVRCFVEDCGYTSAWDEFKHELKKRFHLPAFPLMYTTSALCRYTYGWSFDEASPLNQVAKCTKPMLFIHGDADTFVPTAMVYPLYKAKPQPKALWIAKGSAHANSYKDHPAEYTQQVVSFVSKYIH